MRSRPELSRKLPAVDVTKARKDAGGFGCRLAAMRQVLPNRRRNGPRHRSASRRRRVTSAARPRWPGDRGHPARPSATVFGKDSRHGVGWNRRQILLAHPEGSNFEPARLTIPTGVGIMLTVRKVK